MRAAILFILALFMLQATETTAQLVLFEADFESGMPAEITADDVWSVGTAGQLSSSFFTFPANTNFIGVNDDGAGQGVSSDGRFMTPAIDLTLVEGAAISFEAFFIDGDYEGDDEQGKVLISSDGGDSWTEIANLEGIDEWQQIFLPLTDYVGDTIQIAFEYLDGGGWNFGMGVDDISVYAPPRNEVALERLAINRFDNLVGEDATITSVVTNLGYEAVNALEITWMIDGQTVTETIEGLNIPFGETAEIEHPVPFVPSEAITYDVSVSIASPNGEMDSDETNNTSDDLLSGVTFRPHKKVVFEEGTGTWCVWCPRGFVAMADMKENYPDKFIGIAVHNGDPMTLAPYDDGVNLNGYPGANVDRVLNDVGVSTALFEEFIEVLDITPPVQADVSAEFNAETRELTVNASAEFATRMTGLDYRMSVVITEDSVVGTSSGYRQANAYSFQANNLPLVGAGLDWQAEPNPVPATTMIYNETARALLGGYNGLSGMIPSEVEAGDVFEHTFTYTVPENYSWEHMHAVLLLLDNETGGIANAESTTFDLAVSAPEVFANELVEVFPNPAKDRVNIALNLDGATSVALTVFNAMGQTVATQYLGTLNGEVSVPFDASRLAAGAYTFRLNLGNQIAVKQVIVE
jgi:hypothetical protein